VAPLHYGLEDFVVVTMCCAPEPKPATVIAAIVFRPVAERRRI